MADETYLKGTAVIADLLRTLPEKLEKNVMRRSMRAGMVPIKDQVLQNLAKNRKTGELAKGIKIVSRNRAGLISIRLRTLGKHGMVGRWLEFGTAAHLISAAHSASGRFVSGLSFLNIFRDKVHHPGFSADKFKFMRPAMDTRKADALLAVAETAKRLLQTKAGLDTSGIELGDGS